MKRIIATIAMLGVFSALSFANIYNCSKFYNASASTEGTVVITGQTGQRLIIDKIIANSDLVSGVVKIYEGIPTQAVVADYPVNSTRNVSAGAVGGDKNAPVFVSRAGYSVQIGVTSTAKNSAIVIWHKE